MMSVFGIGSCGMPNLWPSKIASSPVPPAARLSSLPSARRLAKDVESAALLLFISSLIMSGAFSFPSWSLSRIYSTLISKTPSDVIAIKFSMVDEPLGLVFPG